MIHKQKIFQRIFPFNPSDARQGLGHREGNEYIFEGDENGPGYVIRYRDGNMYLEYLGETYEM